MTRIVQLNEIYKSYTMGDNHLQVLRKVNLSVKKGEFLAVLGASGSGKSTLMNIIGCMDTADSGEYLLDGQSIKDSTDYELSQTRNQRIGFIFQKYHLIPQYTILQNVIMPLLIQGMTRNEAKDKAEGIIQMVGLWDRIRHKPRELSGGQQQRVAIARALVTAPALLLADEPTGALDSKIGKEILSLFVKLNDLGNTIIMITHDTKVAENSKRIVYIDDGVLTESLD